MDQVSPVRPIIIAGPCMAESYDLLEAVVAPLKALAAELQFEFFFKASFDKANRSSIHSYRGPGLDQGMRWFADLKSRHGCKVLTDVHETVQVGGAAEVCDVLQIPAFLCRQTDLLLAAVNSGRQVNVKKGQFLAPQSIKQLVGKVRAACDEKQLPFRMTLTERGTCFGYGDLVVDMRAFGMMAEEGVPLIFDITHSTQQPPNTGGQQETGALRRFAPLLARAAAATGYLAGFFLEVHPEPNRAKSDATSQLSIEQAETLLRQILPIWHTARQDQQLDKIFV